MLFAINQLPLVYIAILLQEYSRPMSFIVDKLPSIDQILTNKLNPIALLRTLIIAISKIELSIIMPYNFMILDIKNQTISILFNDNTF